MDEDSSLRSFACASSRSLSGIAQSLSNENNRDVSVSPKLVDLAARLHNVAEALNAPCDSKQAPPLRRIKQYLGDLEKLCSPSLPRDMQRSSQVVAPSQFPRLFALSNDSLGPKDLGPLLRSFVRSKYARESFYKNISRLTPRCDKLIHGPPSSSKTEKPLTVSIQNELHHALTSRHLCECNILEDDGQERCTEIGRHEGYLKLARGSPDEMRRAVFDAAFRSFCRVHRERPLAWKTFRVYIDKNPGEAEPSAVQHALRTGSGNEVSQQRPAATSTYVSSKDFCCLLHRRKGPVYHRLYVANKELYDLGDPPVRGDQLIQPEANVPLSALLESYDLTDDGKLLLAYTIAYSVWRHYGSDLMTTRWTTEHICFFNERTQPPHDNPFNPIHVFVPLRFMREYESLDPADREFISKEGLVHRAPRISSLGAILAEILGPRPVNVGETSTRWDEALNVETFLAHAAVSSEGWPKLDLQTQSIPVILKGVVQACLDTTTFSDCALTESQRKEILYTKVVLPLQYVLRLVNADARKATWIRRNPSACTVQLSTSKNEPVDQHGVFHLFSDIHARDSSRQHNGHVFAHHYHEAAIGRSSSSTV